MRALSAARATMRAMLLRASDAAKTAQPLMLPRRSATRDIC